MANSEWENLALTAVFLAAIYLVGRLAKTIMLPPIVGEIITGIVLGPHVFNIVPFSDIEQGSIFSVFGNLGVALLIFESGLHVNIDKIIKLGFSVFVISVMGTIIPISLGLLAFWLMGIELFPGGLAAAIAIGPASVGISLRILLNFRKLNSDFGQAIVTAATIDDLFALVLFVVVQRLDNELTFETVGLPVIYAIIFLGLTIPFSLFLFSKGVNWVLERLENQKTHSFEIRDEIHMLIIFGMVFLFGYIGHLVGSHLLGAFLAGLSFSRVTRSLYLWNKYIKDINSWLLRLFFAATVAFAIPINILFNLEAFWKGLIIGFVCIVSKLLASIHIGNNRWLIGWALVSRGEFSYLIIDFALTSGLINIFDFSVVIWGLLLSTLIAPVILRLLIIHRINTEPQVNPHNGYHMIIEGHHHIGVTFEISNVLRSMGYDLEDTDIRSDGNTNKLSFFIYPEKGTEDLNDEKCKEIKHEIIDVVGDQKLQIIFEPADRIEEGKLTIDISSSEAIKARVKLKPILKEHGLSIHYTKFEEKQSIEGTLDLCYIETTGKLIKLEEKEKIYKEINKMLAENNIDAQIILKLEDIEEDV